MVSRELPELLVCQGHQERPVLEAVLVALVWGGLAGPRDLLVLLVSWERWEVLEHLGREALLEPLELQDPRDQ